MDNSEESRVEPFHSPGKLSLFRDYNDPRYYGFIALFYAEMENPLSIWDKQRRGEGQISRTPDEDDGAQSLYISALVNPGNTYIMTPKSPFTTLGIKLSCMTFVLMSLRRSVTITIQIRDTAGCLRRFILSNSLFQPPHNTENVTYLPLHFECAWAWNEIHINLAQMTLTAFKVKFDELVRVQVTASCRIRLIYCSTVTLQTNEYTDLLGGIMTVVSQDLAQRPLKYRAQSYLLVASFQPAFSPSVEQFLNGSSDAVKPVVISRWQTGEKGKRRRRVGFQNDVRGRGCQNCMTRMPYATLIATILCLAGVGIFCGTMYRGITITRLMFEEVFHFHVDWIDNVQLSFVILGASMGALGLMILFVGFLTTGETRRSVYKAWRARVGGRISCAVFMVITYILQIAWLIMFSFLVIVTATYSVFWTMCKYIKAPYDYGNCIDFTQFHFLFPGTVQQEDMKVCGNEMKDFCKDYVERAEAMFILATISSALVILSLVHYLMCLSANYAHIKDHEKLQDFQELRYFATGESEMTALAGKDRF